MNISTKDFIFSLLFCFLPTNICAKDITTNISYSQQKMDSAWSFLPEVPSAFKDSTSSEIAVKIENSSFYASLADADFDLKLLRITEPKNVDLQAQKRNFKAGYKFNVMINNYGRGEDVFVMKVTELNSDVTYVKVQARFPDKV